MIWIGVVIAVAVVIYFVTRLLIHKSYIYRAKDPTQYDLLRSIAIGSVAFVAFVGVAAWLAFHY